MRAVCLLLLLFGCHANEGADVTRNKPGGNLDHDSTLPDGGVQDGSARDGGTGSDGGSSSSDGSTTSTDGSSSSDGSSSDGGSGGGSSNSSDGSTGDLATKG